MYWCTHWVINIYILFVRYISVFYLLIPMFNVFTSNYVLPKKIVHLLANKFHVEIFQMCTYMNNYFRFKLWFSVTLANIFFYFIIGILTDIFCHRLKKSIRSFMKIYKVKITTPTLIAAFNQKLNFMYSEKKVTNNVNNIKKQHQKNL